MYPSSRPLFFSLALNVIAIQAHYVRHAVHRFRNEKWERHSTSSISFCAALCTSFEATFPLCNAFTFEKNSSECSLTYLSHGDYVVPYSKRNVSIPATMVYYDKSFLRGNPGVSYRKVRSPDHFIF